MSAIEYSINIIEGGTSEKVSISSTSAASTAIGKAYKAVVTSSVDCFMRAGASPTALSTGVDQFLLAGVAYRVYGLKPGDKLAFITTAASGTVYISPGA